jgi:hypothetical protein
VKVPVELEALPASIAVHTHTNGWMTTTMFQQCMEALISEVDRKREQLKMIGRKALLIADGHVSRNNPTLWKILETHGIDLLLLPPHTSHLLQPLDRHVNAVLKKSLRKLWTAPLSTGIAEYREELVRCLPEALHRALSPFTITESWGLTGILPYLPATILGKLVDKHPDTESYFAGKRGGLATAESLLLTADRDTDKEIVDSHFEEAPDEYDEKKTIYLSSKLNVPEVEGREETSEDFPLQKVKRKARTIIRDESPPPQSLDPDQPDDRRMKERSCFEGPKRPKFTFPP